jgi:hypothetical protein
VVQRDRGARHLVQRWTVFLERGSERIRVRGDLVWVPGPSPWPWLIGALVLALAVVVVVRSRHARIALVVVLALLVASESAHVIGAWGATTASGGAKLFASAYSLGGLALAVTAIVWVVRGGTYAATPLVLLAGLFLAVAGGLADITTLLRSQIPTTDAAEVARLEVMLALGLGGGLAVAAGLALRPGAARRPRVRVGAA